MGEDEGSQPTLNDYMEGERWLWMTNIWNSDGGCGSGYLRQYRQRLGSVLVNDNMTAWELMYTHKFPGTITHSSISKRSFLERELYGDHGTSEAPPLSSTQDEDAIHESIRLAVVIKVIEDERVSYHSRVYHFGIFETDRVLEECDPLSTDTCHAHAPFLNFDYILPGSMPIKDFSLEHDMMLYSRRQCMVQDFKVAAYGHPTRRILERPIRVCVRNSRTVNCDDLHVLMAQVREYTTSWEYKTSIATELSEVRTGNKRWATDEQWGSRSYLSPVQENDMITGETQIYGTPIQKPYLDKSLLKEKDLSEGTENHEQASSGANNEQQEVQGGPRQLDTFNLLEQDRLHQSPPNLQGSRPNQREQYQLQANVNYKSRWFESVVEVGALDAVDTDQGIVNEENDIMALKTTGNSVLILRRDANETEFGFLYSQWRLSMVMSDDVYNPAFPTSETERREVLAMRIVRTPVSALALPITEIYNDDHPLADLPSTQRSTERTADRSEGYEVYYDNDDPLTAEETDNLEGEHHNVLLMVLGDGKVVAYDLDRSAELSTFVVFMQERYQVVIDPPAD
ncbi:hypothetical protein BGW38_004189 [Lunasporangiospora selenospora]|uniref:Uncharacterized protein n=1 Tax=Lunasporangiospora selenospora TaxID=979761 RepID=A0A9P6KIT0_9FUNG|nr:hypothetical protein BGW38_004189 [Lunasporangiospora selenospora]